MRFNKQAFIQTNLGPHRIVHAHPGNHALDLDSIRAGRAALGVGDQRGLHFGDLAAGVFAAAGAFDDVAVFQAHLVAGEQAEEAFGRRLFKVGAFNPYFLADFEAAFAQLGVVRVHGGAAVVELARTHDRVPVGQHQFDGVEHGHGARGDRVQRVAQCAFERAVVNPAVALGHAYAFGKQLNRFGGVAAAAQADEGGHAGVVPAGDSVVVHQLGQFALAGQHVGEVKACKFVLVRVRRGNQAAFAQAVQQPVVKRALVFKLQRADAVGDLLQRVLDRVRKGVHGVNAPFVVGVVVVGAAYAVNGRVAHVDVGAGHVDLGAQHHGAVLMQAVAHFAKACQVLLGRAAAEGAVGAGVGKVAAADAHFFD